MTAPIVLKDSTGTNVTFNFTSHVGNILTYDSVGDSLLNRKRLTINFGENAKVNRVKMKLSVPSVVTVEGVPTVGYTQVASSDHSVVRASTAVERADLAALFANLQAAASIQEIIKNGVMPA